jgi:hypothetical protein
MNSWTPQGGARHLVCPRLRDPSEYRVAVQDNEAIAFAAAPDSPADRGRLNDTRVAFPNRSPPAAIRAPAGSAGPDRDAVSCPSQPARNENSACAPSRSKRDHSEDDTTLTSRTAVVMTYTEFPNKLVSAANGVDYAYREAGDGEVPLVLLQHFRGNLDS